MKKRFKNFWHGIRFMLQYTKKLNPAVFVPTFFLVILEIAKTFSSILLPQYFIDDITNRSSIRQTMFHLAILIIAIFGIQIFRAAITPYILKAYNQGDANTALDYAFHYVKMEYKDQENDEIRNTQEKLRRNVTANGFVADDLSGFFINLFLVIGFSFIMVRLHVLIYLVFFVIAICNYEFEKKRERYKYEYDQNISKTQRKLTYLFEILIDFQYAKEMRINQASKWASDKIDKEVKEYNQKLSAHTKKLCHLNFFETVLLAIINAVSYGYVVYLAYNGSISIGQMTMYIGTMLAFAQAVGELLASVNRLNMFSVYVKDYETYLENVTSSNKSLLAQTSSQKEGSYDIEFVDVSFKYPNSNTFALQNISLKICTGEKVALIGLNGSGKTTFVKLLCKIYQPTTGKILLNGTDINEISSSEYAKIISVVFQDYKIFSFTFKDNIILSGEDDIAKLDEATRDSGLEDKISLLPDRYETYINKDFSEDGIEFSGGEGQKLALARVLYKNSPIVILDEPTAAVDAIAEQRMYEQISQLTKNKTTIFISHRMSSTKFCDSIYVFDGGKIDSVGGHDKLLQKQGIYEDMFMKQSLYYKT